MLPDPPENTQAYPVSEPGHHFGNMNKYGAWAEVDQERLQAYLEVRGGQTRRHYGPATDSDLDPTPSSYITSANLSGATWSGQYVTVEDSDQHDPDTNTTPVIDRAATGDVNIHIAFDNNPVFVGVTLVDPDQWGNVTYNANLHDDGTFSSSSALSNIRGRFYGPEAELVGGEFRYYRELYPDGVTHRDYFHGVFVGGRN